MIINVLKAALISLNIDKCKFFTQKLNYLGNIVRPGTIEVDEAENKSLRQEKTPRIFTNFALSSVMLTYAGTLSPDT